jgi:hypothetical protein
MRFHQGMTSRANRPEASGRGPPGRDDRDPVGLKYLGPPVFAELRHDHLGVVQRRVCGLPVAAGSCCDSWSWRGGEGRRAAGSASRGGCVASAGGSSSAGAEGSVRAGRTHPAAAARSVAGADRDAADVVALAPAVGCSTLDVPAEDEAGSEVVREPLPSSGIW